MRLTGSVPVLACNHIDVTLDFYLQALQFVIVNKRTTENTLEWAYLKSGDVLLMLEAINSKFKGDGCSGRLYLYVDDAQQLHHYLKAKAYEVSALRVTLYDMQEFDINDPEGHQLTIGQRVTEK